MTNHRFISILVTVFLLFFVILGGAGCGGGHSSFLNKPENENVDEPNEPTPDNMFTVTFDSNGGSEVTSIEVTSGSTIEAPADPTKEGYIFAGWYKDNNTFNELFIFGSNGEKITQDITLYAQWLDPDTLIAEYALSEIVIGYAAGDNPKYVTRDLTLPTKIGSADISWTSNSGAVSSNGTITRQNTDTDVILTATASYNGKTSGPKNFNLKVIKKRTRDNSHIKALTIEEAKSGDITIERNKSGYITDIEGQYVSFDIENADDALDTITVLRNALGIKNPDKELKIVVVNLRDTGTSYSFQQVYNDISIFGRTVMISANSLGSGNFLHSDLLSSDVIVKVDSKNDIGKSTAESKAKGSYSGNVEIDTNVTQKIIYSLDNYESDPVYAYIVRILGTDGENNYIDESVFVNAENGSIITKVFNECDIEAHGTNEFSEDVTFNVVREFTTVSYFGVSGFTYVMKDHDLHIQMNKGSNITILVPITNATNTWDDRHAVSVYSNMLEIMKWWKKSFDRDALDGNGTNVDVVAHAWWGKDNAAWHYITHRISTYDLSGEENIDHFHGAAVDVLAHETGHAVLQYVAGITGNDEMRGIITEAYADIFACIKDQNWQIGETLFERDSPKFIRDIQTPNNTYARGRLQITQESVKEYYRDGFISDTTEGNIEQVKEEHRVSLLISHAAYLMHKDNQKITNGLTWEELGKVWYNSMSLGLNQNSKFESVRRYVIWAAAELVKANKLDYSKIDIIKKAFNEVGITEDFYNPEKIDSAVPPTSSDIPVDEEHFPDEAFRQFISDNKIDRDNNKVLSPEEIAQTTEIHINNRSISSLQGIEYLTSMKILECSLNQLTNLDVSKNTALTELYCSNNQLVSLNVSGCTALNFLDCSLNQLTTLDVSNCAQGIVVLCDEGVNVIYPSTPSNPEENPDTLAVTDIPIDEAHFPDAGFRAYINDKIDSNKDSILNKTEIQDTTKIDVGFWNYTIHSLQGIEYFTNLKELHCNSQSLTSLDLSKNTALQVLGCNGNQLTMLNVSGCNMLKEIHCDGDLNSNTYGNRLTKLDVSSCTALEYLSCRGNKLTELDVSKNIALKNLLCDVNQLTFLDVRKNTALQGLVCGHNQLAELDVSKNNDLQRLDCSYNKLVILDISKNVKLQKLTCWNNQLTVLDVSGCSSLEQIYCSHNQLIELDLAENTALQELSCRDNQLIELKNISDCTALRTLDCWNNQLTELDLTKNVVLSKLECRYNQLTVLDVSHCYQYINVYCDNNVIVTYPPSRTTSLSTANSNALEDTSIIVANLPTFIAGTTGEYSFNVSLDKIVSAESTLFFKNASENLFGVFLDENGEEITMPTTTSLDRVKVSALFDAGVTYSPVIIAQSDETLNNSGGCNGEACGIFTLSLLCILAQKVQHKHNKKRR